MIKKEKFIKVEEKVTAWISSSFEICDCFPKGTSHAEILNVRPSPYSDFNIFYSFSSQILQYFCMALLFHKNLNMEIVHESPLLK